MRRTTVVAVAVTSLAALVGSVGGLQSTGKSGPAPAEKPQGDAAAKQRAEEAYGRLPLAFEANVGQTDPEVANGAFRRGHRRTRPLRLAAVRNISASRQITRRPAVEDQAGHDGDR